ncbi:lipoprotein [Ferrimonas futtsuensis]|uniref:lipoprotein n=1 Tax=Ferrimonas futtsuensis TaxID=364764 RepID=UPI000412F446|nr:lipoprotein [Ferrimonas futtsuensis]
MKRLLWVTLLLLAGCSKVNQQNYDKLELGMSRAEVEAVLGRADRCSGSLGTETCIWGGDHTQIKVGFAADQAMLFSHKGL